MRDQLSDPIKTWLIGLDRQSANGRAPDLRELIVDLRGQLPPEFRPTEVPPEYLLGPGLSLRGLQAIGAEGRWLPDLERLVLYIRNRLIKDPKISRMSATEIATALAVPERRAQRLLSLAMQLGSFCTGGTGTGDGYGMAVIEIGGVDVVSSYMGFESIDSVIRRLDQERERQIAATRGASYGGEGASPFRRGTVFIVMNMNPKDPGLTEIRDAIKEVCATFGLQAFRIDEVEHQERITDRILESIVSSEFVIADLSGERPNVYYEVGYAHAIGKHPILFRRQETTLHFDLSVHNVPEYRDVDDLRGRLTVRLQAILGRSPVGVTDAPTT